MAMQTLMQGRTTFIIAHRLSTVRDAEEILVFDNGRVVERGGFEALIEAEWAVRGAGGDAAIAAAEPGRVGFAGRCPAPAGGGAPRPARP